MGDAKTVEKAPKKSWFKGLKAEFKKIIWPDTMSVAKQTTAVIVVSVILGVLIKIIDMLIQLGLDFII
jgi:preprotein translocase subunit SecE